MSEILYLDTSALVKLYIAEPGSDWPILWQRANQHAEAHTPAILCRTLDILHVAIAETAGTDLLITGDGRLLELCRAIGLKAQAIPT